MIVTHPEYEMFEVTNLILEKKNKILRYYNFPNLDDIAKLRLVRILIKIS